MGYLDSDGLKRFAQNVKNKAMWNWQWTKTAPCVHFWPGEETELEPVVDFSFISETPPVEGEKSPDNPSTINGLSKVVVGRCGKNLCSTIVREDVMNQRGISWSLQEDGGFHIQGTAHSEYHPYLYLITADNNEDNSWPSAMLQLGKTYTFSIRCADSNVYAEVFTGSSERYGPGHIVTPDSPYTYTVQEWNKKFLFRIAVQTSATIDTVAYVQIEEGEEATSFEKYDGNEYIYSLGDTYYRGSVNLKTGELTATVGRQTINQHITFSSSSDQFLESETAYSCTFYPPYCIKFIAPTITQFYKCNKLPVVYTHNPTKACIGLLSSSYGVRFCLEKTTLGLGNGETFSTVSTAMKNWLRDNPVTYVYPMSPQIIQLTPQQILSLPRLDHYVPRTNFVYTDQQSVKVGYKKIDNADSHSDEEISGTKAFASSPLVPNPNDLDSQQAAPISFTKDMMRAEIEALTSGRNTIVRDQWDNPHIMVVMPKFMLSAIDPSWPNEPHPAFIVNGVQKSEVLIGKYLASQSSAGKAQTLPGQLPWANITFDNSLIACRALGNSFGMNTNAIWAARALWLWKTMPSGHEYLGNSNYGRTNSNHMLTGTPRYTYGIPGDKSTSGRTLTGTGGILWNDNEEVDGIADLSGNVYEWCSGLRLMNGEIQIISNNDALMSTMDLSTNSSNWKAILQNGSLVAPNTTDTLKYDGTNPDTTESWSNAGTFKVNTTIVNPNTNGCYRNYFKDTTAISGVTIPNILKVLALYPVSSNVQGGSWVCTNGERLALRGGGYATQNLIGPFNLGLDEGIRTYQTLRFGFRTAYIP